MKKNIIVTASSFGFNGELSYKFKISDLKGDTQDQLFNSLLDQVNDEKIKNMLIRDPQFIELETAGFKEDMADSIGNPLTLKQVIYTCYKILENDMEFYDIDLEDLFILLYDLKDEIDINTLINLFTQNQYEIIDNINSYFFDYIEEVYNLDQYIINYIDIERYVSDVLLDGDIIFNNYLEKYIRFYF